MWLREYLNVWILAGVAAVAVLLLFGDWLLTGWIANVLRNHLAAKPSDWSGRRNERSAKRLPRRRRRSTGALGRIGDVKDALRMDPKLPIRSLDYTVIFARQMPAMREFYGAVLGFPLHRELSRRWIE